MEGTEEVGIIISDFGSGGCRCQYARYISQDVDPSSATIWIGDMGHDPIHRQDAEDI